MKTYSITPDKFFNRNERKQLLKTCQELADLDLMKGRQLWVIRYMLVDLTLFSGLRVAEIADLKLSDIQLKTADPYLFVRNGKGNRKRVVYIDKVLTKHLKQFINYKKTTLGQDTTPNAPLFCNGKGKPNPPITLMKSFKVAVKKAGLPDHYSIHSARHTYATFLYHDTKNLKYVQKQLGHSNISVTSLYADILPEENGRLANKISRD